MPNVTIEVRTGQKVGGSEDKFYRTYRLPTCALFQWGSQRNGRSGGQFKIAPSPLDAMQQSEKKRREGYTYVGGTETFQVDEAKLQTQLARGPKEVGQFLDSLYAASGSTGQASIPAMPDVWESKPTPVTPAAEDVFDRLSMTNQRALAAITLATNDPAAALTEYSLLNDALADLEADVRKVKSYLGTLEVLVEEAM